MRRGRGLLRAPLVQLGLLALVVAVATIALAGSNVVPASYLGQSSRSVDANALKPAACAGMTLTGITFASGTFNFSTTNQLVIGTSGLDRITDKSAGPNCIVGGGGGDSVTGNNTLPVNDVCIVGPGGGTYRKCTQA